jgi:hypothetical protein
MTTKIRTDNTDLGSDTSGIVIPKGTTGQRSDSTGAIRFNTTTTLFEYYDGSGWTSLEPTPTITSVTPTSVKEFDSTGTTTFTITGTGFKSGITANLIDNNGATISFDTLTRNSNTSLTAVVSNANVINAPEPFDIKVTSASGLTSTALNQININNNVYFVTASGSLGTQRVGNFSAFVQAIDPESVSVGYEISSGALPSGFSLNRSTGEISGTITLESSDTTYTFFVRAYDDASNITYREFSITLQGPVGEEFLTSGTFNVPVGVSTVDLLIVGGGGGGGTGNAGGGGAGGLIYRPAYPVTPGGSFPISIGSRSAQIGVGNPTSLTIGGTTLTADGGGAGGSSGAEGGQGGQTPGGSGGGGPGAATQPGKPGDSGTYGFGNAGGSMSDTGGGGGGAGAAGGNGGGPGGSNSGGVGRAYDVITPGSPIFYAGGGGGGGGYPGGRPGGPGGSGGGGGGSGPYYDSASPGSPGTDGTGGGGGGAVRGFSMQGMSVPGSTGGSGVVIVRY